MGQKWGGRYLPGDSCLHRLDARTKLLCLLLLLAAILRAASPAAFLLALAALGVLAALSRLPAAALLGPLLRLWPFFLLVLALNALFYGGGEALWRWRVFRLTGEGLGQGLRIVGRVALVMLLSQLLTASTAPMSLASALAWLLRPLGWLGVPVEDVAMILGAALQFIPALSEEAEALKCAQTARGAPFESRRLLRRLGCFLPLALPVFLAAFRRADELAMAIEARGCRGGGRRAKHPAEPFHRRDHLALALCAALCCLQFILF